MEPGAHLVAAEAYLTRVAATVSEVDLETLSAVAGLLTTARDGGHRVFVVGNGGSATVAAHLALSLTHDLARRGGAPVSTFALTEPGALSAVANDESVLALFASQLRAHLRPDDVVVAFSASGRSANVVEALRYARSRGAATAAIVGNRGPALTADVCLNIECDDAGVAEDVFAVLTHAVTVMLAAGIPGHAA